MKLDDVVEAEVPVTHMTKRALHTNLGALFGKVNAPVNSFQHDLLHKEIVSQITHLLAQDKKEETFVETTEPTEDPRIEELIAKVDKLEKLINTIDDRLGRVESISN